MQNGSLICRLDNYAQRAAALLKETVVTLRAMVQLADGAANDATLHVSSRAKRANRPHGQPPSLTAAP